MKKINKIIVIFLTILLLISIFIFSVFSYYSNQINKDNIYVFKTIKLSLDKKDEIPSSLNFIILGLDPRDDGLEKTEVTDTIILASLNTKSAQLSLISLPRDLWDYQNNKKINHIYQDSKNQENSFSYIKDNYSRITGQKINNVIVVTTQNLIDFVELIGGVDVYLETGFIDKEFPNEEYIKNPSPDISVYKTVEFPSGEIHLNTNNVSEFVRSRKGVDLNGNEVSDLGRIHRQQLLIEAIISKIKSKSFLKNPNNLIYIYNFWHQSINHDLEDDFVLSLILNMNKNLNNFSLKKIDIPIKEKGKDGVIYHPKNFINRQWVFIPNDKEYQSLIDFINNSIN